MSNVKVMLKVMSKGTPPECADSDPVAKLKAKVEHAVGCIDAGVNSKKAVAYLQHVFDMLESLHAPVEGVDEINQLIKPIVNSHGYVKQVKEDQNG